MQQILLICIWILQHSEIFISFAHLYTWQQR